MSESYYGKEVTNFIKGIAIIIMFLHHFFTFPGWWGEEISYPLLERIATYSCKCAQICVPIFCFLTGYGYYFNKSKTIKYSLKKITDLFVTYWFIFFVFAVIAVINGYEYTVPDFFLELFALKRPTMRFCWYVFFYYSFMLVLPFATRLMGKNIIFDLLIALFALPILFYVLEKNIQSSMIVQELCIYFEIWFPIVLCGFIVARYQIFQKIEECIGKLVSVQGVRMALFIILFVFLPIGRIVPLFMNRIISISIINDLFIVTFFDFMITPLYIFSIVNLCKLCKFVLLQKIIMQLGKQSLLMWFVSCIFFNNSKRVFQPVLYFLRNPMLVLVWGIVLCYAVSYIIDLMLSKVVIKKNDFIFRRKKEKKRG